MGMAASQARLLTITSRLHDVEYQAQSIQNAKIALATQSDEVYKDYLAALDHTTLTIKNNNDQTVVANFNSLCGINAAKSNYNMRYLLRDEKGRIVIGDDEAKGYEDSKGIVNNAYEYAMYMLSGKPSDFNGSDGNEDSEDKVAKAKMKAFDDKIKSGKLPSNISTALDSLIDQIHLAMGNIKNVDPTLLGSAQSIVENNTDQTDDKASKEAIKNDLVHIVELLKDIYNTLFSAGEDANKEYMEKIAEINPNLGENLENIINSYQEFEYKMYTCYSEDIYEEVNGTKAGYDEDKFWYYANIYKQIEANGGRYTIISEYNGIDGVGDAANDDDWLQRAVQSGKITIDISTLDSKGNISFKSTGVPSDDSLEYTTTTTIDKSYYAKVEAEYEHKTKQIDQKDKKYDMDLSKLETERNALTTEYDSVKKVVEDNVKRTFGIFS